MALPLAIPFIAGSAVAGMFGGGLRNNAEQRQANQDLFNAQLQAELYEVQVNKLSAEARVNSEGIFSQAAEVRGERLASLAGRGISLDSQVVESVNTRERENVINAVNNVVSNAYMEAENLRTQGRLGVQAARTALRQIRQRREGDILLGGATAAFNAGAQVVGTRAAGG